VEIDGLATQITAMTDHIDPPRLTLTERLLYAIPILGWMLKDVVHGDRDNIWYFLAAILSLWIMGIMSFGFPAVVVPVVVIVPAVFLLLVTITRG
jgi:hypothetical protein